MALKGVPSTVCSQAILLNRNPCRALKGMVLPLSPTCFIRFSVPPPRVAVMLKGCQGLSTGVHGLSEPLATRVAFRGPGACG